MTRLSEWQLGHVKSKISSRGVASGALKMFPSKLQIGVITLVVSKVRVFVIQVKLVKCVSLCKSFKMMDFYVILNRQCQAAFERDDLKLISLDI